ncbi:phosducin-like protein [Ceratobasidium sp. AG-Ba]|nr:phosducin-like protein [Ceratobasidium sp. AG-Ba]QRW07265.1 phosducin-like protein [Ceratobasidium sp. AG-Ba]
MDAGLEELVLSGALFNGGEEGKRSPQRSRSVTPEPNTDDELFGSDISRPESPVDSAQAQNSIGRTGVKGVIRDRAEARERENARRTQEIAELNAKMEKAAITARTFKEDEEAARKEAEEEERGAKEQYRRRRWRELKERATGGNAGFGHLREIGVHGFVEAVESEKPQTWVVIHIYELGITRCSAVDDALARLARSYVSTKFVRTRASAIGFAAKSTSSNASLFDPRVAPRNLTTDEDDFDEEDPTGGKPAIEVDTDMLPTLLVYRGGQLEHTFIRVDWEAGDAGIHNLLVKHGVIPAMSFSNPNTSFGLGESDAEYDLDD